MDAVGRDEDIAAHREPRPAGAAVGEMGGDAALVLHEAGERKARSHRSGAESLQHRIVQHPLQATAVDRELRHRVAGVDAARLAPHLLALAVEVDEFARAHAHPVERGEEADLGKLADRVRQRVDADADLAHLRRLLVEASADAAPLQHEGGGEPPNPRADDDDPHLALPGARSCPSSRMPRMNLAPSGRDMRYAASGGGRKSTSCRAAMATTSDGSAVGPRLWIAQKRS